MHWNSRSHWLGCVPALGAASLCLAALGCDAIPGYRQHKIAQLSEALNSTSVDERVAALQALSTQAADELPDSVAKLVVDRHPEIRRAAVLALAAHRHPDTLRLATTALADPDLEVRLAAIHALGELGNEEAQAALADALREPSEKVRATAAGALTKLKDAEAVARALDDKAWQVRLAVASALAEDPRAEAIATAKKLVADKNLEVQKQIIQSISKWPLELATPVLLTAAESQVYLTSKLAAEQLVARWPAAHSLTIDPPRDPNPAKQAALKAQRDATIAALRNQWERDFGARINEAAAAIQQQAIERVAVPLEKLRAAQQRFDELAAAATAERREAALATLTAMGNDLLVVLDEQVRLGNQQPTPEEVFMRVLPQIDSRFALLADLRSSDVAVRRRAAEQLASQAASRELSPAAIARLSSIVTAEQDATVWQHAFAATMRGASAAALQMAQAGLSHQAADVRRRAAEWIAQHPDVRHTPALLATLRDPQSAVVVAAIRALAANGQLTDPAPLEAQLVHRDATIRLEAATALAQMKFETGRDALIRLGHDTDPIVRRQAALAMGRVKEPAFVPTLVELLDDSRSGVQQAALESLPLIAGQDYGRSTDGKPTTPLDQAQRWKTWSRTTASR